MSSIFVTLILLEGVAIVLLSNLGTRFCLRGVGCDAPGFQPELINPNDLVNSVDFGQTTVNLGHHLENITNDP
jgi:hypothetical protein